MARVRAGGAGAIRSLGLFVVVWLVNVYRTNTGSHTDMEAKEASRIYWQQHSSAT